MINRRATSWPTRIYVSLLLSFIGISPSLHAQQSSPVAATNSPAEQIAALQLQLTNAWQRVLAIVNQPVTAYARTPAFRVSVYSPGWFHEGAETPDFNTVDVRKTQQLIYTNQYVTSDLNPGIMFMGRDLEFNAMTKLFYTNRSLPKHRLSEAEMLEINQLYRTIGQCQNEISRLQNPVPTETAATADAQSDTEPADSSNQLIQSIRHIPRQTRILYGGIAIGALIVLVLGLRLVRKKSD